LPFYTYLRDNTTADEMIDPNEIKELGYKVKERDERAFRVLYRAYFAPLHRYATRYVYDAREAEDIVQEAFFALWKNAEAYRPEQSVVTYLLVIVKNECINYLRHLKIKDSHHDKLVEAALFAGVEEASVDSATRERLRKTMQRLPEREREVLALHVFEGQRLREIAKTMNVAESTVKTHLKRAMKTLREAIREE
jgi:RNA polymerase sigma-70 factor (ECF subfamily)